VSDSEISLTPGARVHVLHEGYVREAGDEEHVGGTVTLIIDGDAKIVIDPGMVASRAGLLAALAERGIAPGAVTDIVFSHHHPDHTVNAALFPAARIHDHWAIYHGDLWTSRDAEGAALGPSVRLLRTPGHTAEDITTLAATPDGVYACTHAWWGEDGPDPDPLATDPAALSASRSRILELADVIIPGHGIAFRP
jgi:glyoxylase-like metal-dependent hydrolase (beta-lactamase superfamily II)